MPQPPENQLYPSPTLYPDSAVFPGIAVVGLPGNVHGDLDQVAGQFVHTTPPAMIGGVT